MSRTGPSPTSPRCSTSACPPPSSGCGGPDDAGQRARRRRQRRVQLQGVPMRCWDARQHVSDYLDGDLDAATASMLERHLEQCPPVHRCTSLAGVHVELGGLRDPDAVVPPASPPGWPHLSTRLVAWRIQHGVVSDASAQRS
ncbi:MAG: zf-HC2 domain-containing protein [Acidimicrobiales bacterium]